MVVVARSGPGMVWLVFFFSSASLERKGGREVRRKVSQE
jgi:hypothetical protein